jgi:predicted P-loop ATPase
MLARAGVPTMSNHSISTLLPADLDVFAKFKVDVSLLEKARIWRATDAQARSERKINGTGNNAGVIFDYFHPTEPLQWRAARLRRDAPGDGPKYLCPAGKCYLYFVPGFADRLKDPSVLVIFVEAEKSVLAGTAWAERTNNNALFVGTGGCYGWQRDSAPHPDLNLLAWQDREVIILFDSNATTNQNVQVARSRFAAELKRRGARVFLADLPNDVPGLNGPDDCIALLGDGALAKVLNDTVEFTDDWRTQLQQTKSGELKPSTFNADLFLRHSPEWQGVLTFNEMTLYIETAQPPPWPVYKSDNHWEKDDTTKTYLWLQAHGVGISSPVLTLDVIKAIAREHPFHPIERYLTGLVWDGTPRIDSWLTTYLGAEDLPVNRAMGAKYLIQAVARMMRPGCQADATLVVIGPQGFGKSSTFRVLAGPEYFGADLSDLGSKDSKIELCSCWIVELGEFITHRSELERKSFLTQAVDTFRPPYEVAAKKVKRSCVFAATSNDNSPLTDATGGRRYWSVTCGITRSKADIEKLKANRDQLWAEAFQRYQAGEPWHADSPEFQAALDVEQESRYAGGPYDPAILPWLRNPKKRPFDGMRDRTELRFDSEPGRVTLNDALLHGLGRAQHEINHRDILTARDCVVHAGWKLKISKNATGTATRFYVRKEACL